MIDDGVQMGGRREMRPGRMYCPQNLRGEVEGVGGCGSGGVWGYVRM